ncbi:hypothetical protein O3M35_001058 [Rhynocoris fuscipes]|uniref:CUB domain-containing protein n=1 Tax=Rhynocoris fuscipes TaxID=488301 RepID=A0AAW1DPK2_9HEMI
MGVLWLILWTLCFTSGKWTMAEEDEECGGLLTTETGLLQTPNFPKPFKVPIKCRWIIDSSMQPNQPVSIVIYLTQLFVTTGLTFTEYAFYEPDSSFQLEPKLVFAVTEDNAITTQWVYTRNQYFVVEFTMDRLEGNHVRVLDDLLDVYGFNITYEMVPDYDDESPVRNSSCNLLGCSLAGNCFVTHDFS